MTFKYDPFGRRIEKISPSATSIFAYDGANLVQTVNSTGGLVARYTQTTNIDEPLAMQRGGATDYHEQDGLGSVTSLTATNGSIVQNYTYDSFGNTTASTGSLRNYFQYTGREFDTETGLYYYRARYYDPFSGRFTSEDQIGFAGGGFNVYRYSLDNPVNLEDPSGLTVSCTYNQSSRQLSCTDDSTGNVILNTFGYSGGNEGKCSWCVNNPATQGMPFSGPIPTGYWNISTCFTWHKMPDVSRLTPLLGSSFDAFVRSPGFLIHGGRQNGARTASEGCIIIGQPQRGAICQSCGGIMHVISGLPPSSSPFSLSPPYPGIRAPF
ncbi:MAG TPA: RHS repeat-associated core domain-containing protein [Verrucomicrobiae bacterium]|nr:RHS repeat-associated core domain-containing protein [Verrucomicrobiae bacterium]